MKTFFLSILFFLSIFSTQIKAQHLGLTDENIVLNNFFFSANQYLKTFVDESIVDTNEECLILRYRPLGPRIKSQLCVSEIDQNTYRHQFIYNGKNVITTIVEYINAPSNLDDLYLFKFRNIRNLKRFEMTNFPFSFKRNGSNSSLIFDSFKVFIEKTDDSIRYTPKCSWCHSGYAYAIRTELGMSYFLENNPDEVGPIQFNNHLKNHISIFPMALSGSLMGRFQSFGLPKNP
ncbi:MAG: hypothetical protein GY909_09460 [Oligoflexia bacterium]|nr:hypothetical protein [Oligoflexia bacterium]